MAGLGQVLTFLIVLSIIVLVHEAGHFIAARLMRVRVEVFSFGFGKRLFGKRSETTDFRVSLIPLGGYVRLAGEEEYDPQHLKADEFPAKNRGQRFFIMVLGAVMNVILAVILIAAVNMTGVETDAYKLEPAWIGFVEKGGPADKAGLRKGDCVTAVNGRRVKNWKDLELAVGTNPKEILRLDYQREGRLQSTELHVSTATRYEIGYAGFFWNLPAEIGQVEKNYPAQMAGLKSGDVIVGVNHAPVDNYFEFREILIASPGKPLQLSIKRGSTVFEVGVTPRDVQGVGILGFNVRIASRKVAYGFFQALGNSVRESVRLSRLTFDAIKKMIAGKLSPKNLSGPLEIARFSQQALRTGFSNFFMLIAFISLQLGLINLLPVPGLDGGHLMILSVETIIRRDLNQKLKTVLIYIGFSLLMALMVFVILNDIAKTLPHGWNSLLPFLK